MTNANLFQLPDLMAATQALTDNLLAAEPIVTYHQAFARFNAEPQARDLVQRLSHEVERQALNADRTQCCIKVQAQCDIPPV